LFFKLFRIALPLACFNVLWPDVHGIHTVRIPASINTG
jgi:hypothetical protein